MNKWKARLLPVIGVAVLGLFIYWVVTYRELILVSLASVGIYQLCILVVLLLGSLVLTVYALVVLVRGKGYESFGFWDGYHTLNLSQLASMIPGGVWGFAGFAGYLWSKGISKSDSAIVIFLNTLIMLTACAAIGISGLMSILSPVYIFLCILPFLLLVIGRNWLDKIRNKYIPESSSLPTTPVLLKILILGVLIWAFTSWGFAGLLLAGNDSTRVSIWLIMGAYAAGYLGGYIAILVPSGLGVSEGIVTLILGPYFGTENVLAVAISFRIIHTIIVWCNILLSVLVKSRDLTKKKAD